MNLKLITKPNSTLTHHNFTIYHLLYQIIRDKIFSISNFSIYLSRPQIKPHDIYFSFWYDVKWVYFELLKFDPITRLFNLKPNPRGPHLPSPLLPFESEFCNKTICIYNYYFIIFVPISLLKLQKQ